LCREGNQDKFSYMLTAYQDNVDRMVVVEGLCISEEMLADVKDVLPNSIFLIRLSTFNSNHIPHNIYIIQQHINSSFVMVCLFYI